MFRINENYIMKNVGSYVVITCELPNGDIYVQKPNVRGIKRKCYNVPKYNTVPDEYYKWHICICLYESKEEIERAEKAYAQYLTENNIQDYGRKTSVIYKIILETIKANVRGLIAISPDNQWVHRPSIRADFARMLLNPDCSADVESIQSLLSWSKSLKREDTLEVVHELQLMCSHIYCTFVGIPIEANDLRVKVLVELMRMQVAYLEGKIC